MIIIKYIGLILIFCISSGIGILYSKKYSKRLTDLVEIKSALIILKNKIKFICEPIPDAFEEISKTIKSSIGKIFYMAGKKMKSTSAAKAWEEAVAQNSESVGLKQEDADVINKLSKMLGNTDVEGQINNIDLVIELIDNQIKKAESEKAKNEKLYKTLGVSVGLTLVIVLI